MHLRRPLLVDRSASLLAGLVLTGAFTIGVALTGCSEPPPTEPAQPSTARPVEVQTAIAVDALETVRFPAVVRATERASLSFLQAGYLAERRVERGQRVDAGQTIAVLYNPALQPGVAAARGAVNEAETRRAQLERDTERLEQLVERELVAADRLEQVRAQRDAAEATLEQARARLDEATAQLEEAELRAPFAGHIADVHVEPGDFAAVGQSIVDLAGDGALEVEIHLPAHRKATLHKRLPDRPIRRVVDGHLAGATLAEIGQAAPGRTAPVVLTLAAASTLAPGDAVEVLLDFDAQPGVAVPLSAVVNPGTAVSRVMRVRDGRAEALAVQVGRLQGRYVTVFGDVEPGDAIVTAGHAQLLDGESVRVLP